MTDPRPVRRRVLWRAAATALLGGLVAALALGPGGAASASLGSVPAEVSEYVSSGAMVQRLNDVYGTNAAGAGIDFDDTTKTGPISRVYEWTAERLADAAAAQQVQLTNNWVVPITIAGKPIGLATLWINPQTVAPELADFDPTPSLATAMAAVPAASKLVRDTASHAWLALDGPTVTALIAGSSGLSSPAPVRSLTLSSSAAAPITAPGNPNLGLGLTIGVVGVIVVVIVVLLLLPRGRRHAKAAVTSSGPDAAAEVAAEAAAEVAAPASAARLARAAVSDPVAIAEHAASPDPAPASKPRPPRAARPVTPVTKPAVSKPGGRTPAGAAASTKPRTQKPAPQKPAPQKPAAQKPPAQKPAAQKPAPQKPAAQKPAIQKPPPQRPAAQKRPVQKPSPRKPKPPADPESDA